MNVRTMATNGLIAAVYIAVTAFIQPFGFTNIQFRVSEMLNHLVVFPPNIRRWHRAWRLFCQFVFLADCRI